MSYVSFLKTLPEFLSQPTGIAVIASLGIHGAIALLLPIVPMNSKPKQQASSKSSVGLVELSQAEQSRLPQPGIPQALKPQASVLPPVPTPNFSNQSIAQLPPMPPSAASTDLILPPLPRTNNIAVASLPRSQSLPILSARDRQGEPSLSTRERAFPRFVDRVKLGQSQPLESSRIPESMPPVQTTNIPQAQDMINSPAPVGSDQMQQPSTQTTESGSEGTQIRQQLVTPVVQAPLAGDSSIALREQNIPQLPPGSNFKVPQLPSLTPESPSLDSQELASSKPKTFAERFTEAKKQYPNIETKQPISQVITAQAQQEGNVEGNLVVNGAGQVESIDFHDNSVSSDLKTSVREYFRDYFQKNPVQVNGKPKFYPFNISFKSDSNISQTSASEMSTSSQVNQTQPITAAQRNLLQRLRPVEVNSLPSKPSEKPAQVNQNRSSRSQTLQQVSQTSQTTSTPQANQERQTLRQQAVVRQSASSSQTNNEQTSQQQVVVKQAISTPETTQEQTSQQEVSTEQSTATSVDSSKKLLQQLRQIRDKRSSSNQEK